MDLKNLYSNCVFSDAELGDEQTVIMRDYVVTFSDSLFGMSQGLAIINQSFSDITAIVGENLKQVSNLYHSYVSQLKEGKTEEEISKFKDDLRH